MDKFATINGKEISTMVLYNDGFETVYKSQCKKNGFEPDYKSKELKYRFINTDLSSSQLIEYLFCKKDGSKAYCYELSHAAGDDVDFIGFFCSKQLTEDEIHQAIRIFDEQTCFIH